MDRLFTTDTGKKLLSIIWGLAIAALLYKVACRDGNCIVIKGPQIAETRNKTFKSSSDGKCYKFNPYTVKCSE